MERTSSSSVRFVMMALLSARRACLRHSLLRTACSAFLRSVMSTNVITAPMVLPSRNTGWDQNSTGKQVPSFLLDRIWTAIRPCVVFQGVHVLSEEFGRIVISKKTTAAALQELQ